MRLKTCRAPAVLSVARGGPLYPYIEPFAESFLERGYSAATADHKILLLRKLDQWLDRHRICIEQLSEDATESFLRYVRGRGRNQIADPSTLRYLLGYLREEGVIPNPVARHDVSPIYRIQTRFAQYLVDERGLSQSTVRHYESELGGFLHWCFPSGDISLRNLSSADGSLSGAAPPTGGTRFAGFTSYIRDIKITPEWMIVRRNVFLGNFVGNRASKELHAFSDHTWISKMASRNFAMFEHHETAIREGYNGCRFCLQQLDTDVG